MSMQFNLKEDIKQLEKQFLKKTESSNSNSKQDYEIQQKNIAKCQNSAIPENTDSCFRLIKGSINELVCELIDSNKTKYRINANICVITFYLLFGEIYIFNFKNILI